MQDVSLTIAEILRHGGDYHADRRVITATGGGYREITYAQCAQRAAQLAHGLRDIGISGDQRVATLLGNVQEHVETLFAVPCMGSVLHTLNFRLAVDQLAYIAEQADDRVVIVDASLAPTLAKVLPQLTSVHTVVVVGDGDGDCLAGLGKDVIKYEALLAGQSTTFEWPDVDELSAAVMCHTSGTTGNPKGVVYSHRSIYLHSMAASGANSLALAEGEKILQVVPIFHANGWGLPHAAVMAGADLLLPGNGVQASHLIDMITDHQPTVAAGVPTVWNDLLAALDHKPRSDISSLRMILCGGSIVPEQVMRTYEEKYGVAIVQLFGMTETSPVVSLGRPAFGASPEAAWQQRSTVGRPVCGVRARIVDDDHNVVPNDGQSTGQLQLRGPWITGTYYRDKAAEKFDGPWLCTGDVGSMDHLGFIRLTDRAKDVIKSGGEWISSVQLENHLMGHPQVLEAAVVGIPDERWQERPLAAVVVKQGEQVSAAELRTYLRDKVASWWLPERWTFVDHVPRTSVGKFDKKHIRTRFAENSYVVVDCRD